MKNFLLGVLTTLLAIAVGIFAYLRLGLAEVRADIPGSRLESYLMSTAVHASVRRQVFWVAKHGIRRAGMFANGKWDSDQKLWTIAAFIKRINALPGPVKEALKPKKPAVDSNDSNKQQ